jgi:hypothetical protein
VVGPELNAPELSAIAGAAATAMGAPLLKSNSESVANTI